MPAKLSGSLKLRMNNDDEKKEVSELDTVPLVNINSNYIFNDFDKFEENLESIITIKNVAVINTAEAGNTYRREKLNLIKHQQITSDNGH